MEDDELRDVLPFSPLFGPSRAAADAAAEAIDLQALFIMSILICPLLGSPLFLGFFLGFELVVSISLG